MLTLGHILRTAAAIMLCAGPAAAAPQAAHSDLTGLWTSLSLTQLERPKRFKTLTISEAEAAEYALKRPEEMRKAQVDDVGGRQSEVDAWELDGATLALIGGTRRTSWIVEPTDGQVPYTAAGRAELERREGLMDKDANPETRANSERCVLAGWGSADPPMLNGPYANQYQIVQTANDVVIVNENNHETRIIPLRGPGHPGLRHLPPGVRPWLGDSIGWWEGATLVVETTNFNLGGGVKSPQGVYIPTDATVTERFSRETPTRLLYGFTVTAPGGVYVQPWRGEMLFAAAKGPMYEYACHEGNYSLPNILAGARRQEADAKAVAAK
jgi:hypothetical protein